VLDCPGLFDTKTDQEGIGHLVIQAVGSMYPEPHALLYVVRIGRYTEEEHGAYRRFKALFGESVTQHMILLFTGGDSLGGAMGAEASAAVIARINERGPKELQEVYRECGRRVVVFDNTARDTESQVQYLLQEVRNMYFRNGGRNYACPLFATCIGMNIEEEVSRRVQKVEKEDAKKRAYVKQLEKEKTSVEREERKKTDHLKLLEEESRRKQLADAQERRRMDKEFQQQLDQQKRILSQQQARIRSIEHDKRQRAENLREKERAMRQRELEREREMEEEKERMEEMARRLQQQADQQTQQQQTQLRRMQQRFQQDFDDSD
jgi:hypothetical protein